MIVVCVKQGTRYGSEWVLRLRSMVAKNLTIPHRFVCLTDSAVDGLECQRLETDLTGWWSKLELFRPQQFPGQILYMDLDVVITANIDGIVKTAQTDLSKLWMRDDFSYSMRAPKQGLDEAFKRFLGGDGCCNSSVMAWHGDAARAVWDEFTPAVMTEVHGDQNHISRVMRDRIGFLPDALVGSYKYHVMRGKAPAPVTVFHGNPKAPDLPSSNPLRQLWEAA